MAATKLEQARKSKFLSRPSALHGAGVPKFDGDIASCLIQIIQRDPLGRSFLVCKEIACSGSRIILDGHVELDFETSGHP